MRWYFRIKWDGWKQPTEETRAWLFKPGNTGRDVREMAKQAMARALMQDSESSQIVEDQPAEESDDDDQLDEGGPDGSDLTAETFSINVEVQPQSRTWVLGVITQALAAIRPLC